MLYHERVGEREKAKLFAQFGSASTEIHNPKTMLVTLARVEVSDK